MWPEHWDALQVFMACDDQWVVHLGMRGLYYQGLDVSKAKDTADWLEVKRTPLLLWQLRVMADEAKPLRNRR